MTRQYVQILGIDSLTGRMRTWPQEIDRATQAQILHEVQPMLGHMRSLAAANGGIARKAARSLRAVNSPGGMSIRVGASPVLKGAEFGARPKGNKRAYATRSRSGNAYIVRRRTKRQFRLFLGTRGYWFWPTVRKDLKGINGRVAAIIAKAVQ